MAEGQIEILVVPDLSQFPADLRNGLQGTEAQAGISGAAIGAAIAAGTAVAGVGFKQVIDIGMQFQSTLNELQSVTSATDAQMSAIGATAQRLGADLTLPATSAADAAEVMLELAKGGLSVDEAMSAASGTIMLAAAAQISGAEAAQIQSAALNSFGLEAGDAGRVADVLANSANAASGEISEFADAMQQVGAVANQFGISIEDTSTALSLFANAGIRGSDAGTLLKSALLALANPSKPAQKAMETLSLSAFDASGNFVGLESIIGQLRDASGRLTPELYAQASAQVFGSDAARLAGIAAGTTAGSWDEMAAAVGRAGGAQEVAAAKTRGLAGAIDSMNSQIETAQLQVYDAISAPLEQAVRAATTYIPAIGESIASGLRVAVAVGQTVGPQVGAAIASGASAVLASARSLVDPFRNALLTAFTGAIQVAVDVGTAYVGVLDNIVRAAAPVATGLGQVADAALAGDGALSAVGTTISVVAGAIGVASAVLVPIGGLIGALVSGFSALPGPIQSVVLAMLALRFAAPLLAGMGAAFNGVVQNTGLFGRALGAATAPIRNFATGVGEARTATAAAATGSSAAGAAVARTGGIFAAAGRTVAGSVGALRQFGGEMRLQQGLAASAGQSIGRLGAAQAAFRTSTLGGVTAARNFGDAINTTRAAAAGAAAPIGTMGAAVRVLGDRVPLLGQMGAAFNNAAAGAARFGGAAGTAAAAASGLRGIGAGLIGALGGPFGAAITAAVIGLGLLGGAQRKAAAEAQEHEATVGSLADALKASGGQFNQNAREVLAGTDQYRAAADGVAQFGINLNDLTSAAVDQGAALDQLRQRLLAIAEANSNEVVEIDSGAIRRSYNDMGLAALAALENVDALASVVNDSRASYAQFAEAVDEAGGSMVNGASSGSSLQGALQVLGDAAADADSKTRALSDALNELSGGQLSLEQANSRLNESLSQIGVSFDAAGAAARGAGTGLLDATGGINTTTEAGRALLSETTDLSSSMASTAQAAFDAAGGFGNLAPATVAARDAAQRAYDAFILAAQGAGLNAEQAAALAARYGLIPDNVVTLLTAQGLDQVDQELLQLKGRFDAVPGQKTVTVQSITDDARARLEEIGFRVTTLPNGQVQVEALTDQALAEFNTLTGQIVGTTATFQLDANPAPANNQISGAVTFANGQTGTVTIDGNQTPVDGKIRASVAFADGSVGTMDIDGNPNPATGQISAVVRYANGSTGTITINPRDLVSPVIARLQRPTSSTHTVVVQERRIGGANPRGGAFAHDGGIFTAMRDGGVLGFAKGGYGTRKGHSLKPMATGLATIVPPNTWRVVGDRMRDDEAYIPINRSDRSRALLEETARRMGFSLARTYATGGIADATRQALAAVRTRGSEFGALQADLIALRAATAQGSRTSDSGAHTLALVAELRAQTTAIIRALQQSPTTSAAGRRILADFGEF